MLQCCSRPETAACQQLRPVSFSSLRSILPRGDFLPGSSAALPPTGDGRRGPHLPPPGSLEPYWDLSKDPERCQQQRSRSPCPLLPLSPGRLRALRSSAEGGHAEPQNPH